MCTNNHNIFLGTDRSTDRVFLIVDRLHACVRRAPYEHSIVCGTSYDHTMVHPAELKKR